MQDRAFLMLLVVLSGLFISTSGAGLGFSEKQEILAAQNRYRSEANISPLIWSENLSIQAQRCADHNAANFLPLGRQKHCPTPGSGQNIARATSGLRFSLAQLVDLWGNEKRYFLNGEYPSVSSTGAPDAVSHYTQMIWQETREVGCGKANASGYDILVCDYSPRGNINGTAVYSPQRPSTTAVGSTNEYKSLRTAFSAMPKRNILINTVFNRPVSCYSQSPV